MIGPTRGCHRVRPWTRTIEKGSNMPDTSIPEVWKPVIGYEGWYSISNLGRVRRDKSISSGKAGHINKNLTDAYGYAVTFLCANAHARQYKVHRLVAAAFIGPCPAGWTVNHKNRIKADNRPENLEYMTHADNMRHWHRSCC